MNKRFAFVPATGQIVNQDGLVIASGVDDREGYLLAAAASMQLALRGTLEMLQTTNKAADLTGSRRVLTHIHIALRDARPPRRRLPKAQENLCPDCGETYDAAELWCPTCFDREMRLQELVDQNQERAA